MYTPRLSHTAALSDSCTKALLDSRAQPRALPHTAWIKLPHTTHRTLYTAHSRTPQLTWIQIMLCECVLHLQELMWIYVNLCESKQIYLYVYALTWIFAWFHLIWFQIIWCIPNLYKSKRIYFEFTWKYAHSRTAAHCCTPGQPHTNARTAALRRAHCRTLPHCRTLHKLKCRTPHTVAHRTQSHTAIKMNSKNCIWMYIHLHECMWIDVNYNE
jgi:hypothetical protein